MQRGLTWALTATVVLSIAALWGGKVPRVVSAIEPRLREAAASPDLPLANTAPPAQASALSPLPDRLPDYLPDRLPQVDAEQAKRDVFMPYVPPPPPAPPPPRVRAAPPAPPAAPPPAPLPQAPSINLRFLGSMVTPAGQRLVYLARGDVAVPVAVGDRLDEGYIVTALTADAVTLTFPPLEMRVVVPIPQPVQP